MKKVEYRPFSDINKNELGEKNLSSILQFDADILYL